MVSESCRSPCLCIPMLGLQAHAAMCSILCGLLGFWTQVLLIAKQAILLNEPSPQPLKIIFFFKSLYWLRIKWGLDRELKYLWGKILQRYPCLYFFTASYFPLMGSYTQDLTLMHALPGVSTPRYHGKLYGKLQKERLHPATHLG